MTGSDRSPTSTPAGRIRPRVYDWWLGGKDNYPVDEELARRILAVDATVVRGARANRRFMQRAVRTAAEAGDTPVPRHRHRHPHRAQPAPGGAGGRPGVQGRVRRQRPDRAAARAGPAARHPRGRHDYVHADVRDPDTHPAPAAETLDFARPVALSLVALTHYLSDDGGDDVRAAQAVRRRARPGSCVILSQVTPDLNPEAVEKAAEQFRRSGTPFFPRSLAEFSRFFDGLELLGPGVIPVSGWRPESGGRGGPGGGHRAGVRGGRAQGLTRTGAVNGCASAPRPRFEAAAGKPRERT